MASWSETRELTAAQSDTFDLIAYDLYGDEFKAADIMELNPAHKGTLLFDGGEVLEVPVYAAASEAEGAAPWRRP